MSFYDSKNDPQLAKDIVSKSADLYGMEDDTPVDDSAVLDKTVPAAAIFTPPVSPVFVADAKIGQVVVIQDDNNTAHEFVVSDNEIISFTVDLTSDVDGDDQSANFTDTSTYSFKLWGPEFFLGWADESSFTDEEELKEFKEGVPRVKIREDLLEKMVSMETILRTPGPDTLQAVNNLKDGSNATYYILKGGSDPAVRPFFYIIAKNTTVDGKNQQLRMYYCQINSNGARVLGGGDEYETIPAMISVNKMPLMEETEDRYRVRIEK